MFKTGHAKIGGRSKGKRNKIPETARALTTQVLGKMDVTPLEVMLEIMRMNKPENISDSEWIEMRLDAASKAAPYVHPRLASIEQTVTIRKSLREYADDELAAILAGSDSEGATEPQSGTQAPRRLQ